MSFSDYLETIEIFPDRKTTLITLDPHEDFRGEFFQVWQNKLSGPGTEQINVSVSHRGVIRGLHFQAFWQQTKLLTVLNGSIIDILVNIDPKSRYFGTFNFVHVERGQQLFVPDKIAHGFISLQDNTTVMYQCNRTRVEGDEFSVQIDDPLIQHCRDKNLNLYNFLSQIMRDHKINPKVSEKDLCADSIFEFNRERFPQ